MTRRMDEKLHEKGSRRPLIYKIISATLKQFAFLFQVE
jgi:hypothetical protein